MSEWLRSEIEKVSSQISNQSWTLEDYSILFDPIQEEHRLSREVTRREKHIKLRKLAEQQGVKPIHSIKDLYGDFWPEEESIDEFLEWLHEIRHSDKPRRLPE